MPFRVAGTVLGAPDRGRPTRTEELTIMSRPGRLGSLALHGTRRDRVRAGSPAVLRSAGARPLNGWTLKSVTAAALVTRMARACVMGLPVGRHGLVSRRT